MGKASDSFYYFQPLTNQQQAQATRTFFYVRRRKLSHWDFLTYGKHRTRRLFSLFLPVNARMFFEQTKNDKTPNKGISIFASCRVVRLSFLLTLSLYFYSHLWEGKSTLSSNESSRCKRVGCWSSLLNFPLSFSSHCIGLSQFLPSPLFSLTQIVIMLQHQIFYYCERTWERERAKMYAMNGVKFFHIVVIITNTLIISFFSLLLLLPSSTSRLYRLKQFFATHKHRHT